MTNPSRRVTPLPPGWRHTIQPRILRRDGHRCTWITTLPDGGHPIYTPGAANHPHRCTARARDVDHIRDRDDHRDDNLRSLCEPHHDARTAGQAARARWSRPEAKRTRPKPKHPGLR